MSEVTKLLLEAAPDGVVVVDPDGTIVRANGTVERMLGYEPGSLEGRQVDSLLPPRYRDAHAEHRRQYAAAPRRRPMGEGLELVALRNDGTEVPVEISLAPWKLDGRDVAVAFVRDVSVRMRTLRALHESETLFRTIFDSAAIGIATADEHGRILSCNRAFSRMLGYTEDELRELPFSAYTYPEDLEGNVALFRDLRDGARDHYRLEKRYLSRDGRVVWVLLDVAAVRDRDGLPYFSISTVEDITDRKRAEEAMRRSAETLEALFESSLEAMFILGDDRTCIDVNPAGCSLYGRTRAELLGGTLRRFTVEGRVGDSLWHRFLDEGSGLGEATIVRPDGERRIIEWSISPDFTPGRHLVSARDVTERRLLEEQLLRSQRLEAVGRLAGGIAHDFNNLLTVVMGAADLLVRALPSGHEERDEAEQILLAAERARVLTRQLLAFSRQQVLRPTEVEVVRVVGELDGLFRRLIGEDVELITTVGPPRWTRADRGQLEQVVTNLVVNARDAMPDGGRLHLRVDGAGVEAEEARALDIEPGGYVRLVVSDTGTGMDGETRERVFDPFFTTKEPGKGTGLGLATVYGIARQLGGAVALHTAPGRGSVFTVYLPAVQAPALRTAEPGPPAQAEHRARVLLVEDDEHVRRTIADLLVECGHAPIAVSTAAEALAAAVEHPVDVLVTDVIMPGMSGRELADALRSSRPHLAVLYVSGYAGEALLSRGAVEPGATFLEKPFTAEELGTKVAEALAARAGHG